MSLDTALRLVELLLGLALLQASLEHLVSYDRWERALFAARAALAVFLILGLWSPLALLGLATLSLLILSCHQGAYNGGSDKMGLLTLWCITLASWAPQTVLQELALAYLAVQLTLSYAVSGYVKLVNADWRSGQALSNVFAFSAYPVAEDLRQLAKRRALLMGASWAVILLETLFPLALLDDVALLGALSLCALFHLANAVLFGLNRFLWHWVAAYPALFWLQDRLV